MQIPTIDLEPLLQGLEEPTVSEKAAETAKQIDSACREFGFLYVSNYETFIKSKGLDPTIVDKLFEKTSEFLMNGTKEQKQAIFLNEHHRGYFGFLDENLEDKRFAKSQERAETTKIIDVKEGIYFGRERPNPLQPPRHVFDGINQYPPEIEGSKSSSISWKSCVEQYFEVMQLIGRAILQGFAIGLKLPKDYFMQFFEDPLAVARVLHYPPVSKYIDIAGAQRENTIYQGTGCHTDYGAITLLAQDDVGGLELLYKDTWIKVPPQKGTLVINLGDALQMWTNGFYRATPHRVVLFDPNQEKSAVSNLEKDRFSIPFFFEPDYESLIKVLPTCIRREEDLQQEGIKYGHYLAQRLSSTFVFPTNYQ